MLVFTAPLPTLRSTSKPALQGMQVLAGLSMKIDS